MPSLRDTIAESLGLDPADLNRPAEASTRYRDNMVTAEIALRGHSTDPRYREEALYSDNSRALHLGPLTLSSIEQEAVSLGADGDPQRRLRIAQYATGLLESLALPETGVRV